MIWKKDIIIVCCSEYGRPYTGGQWLPHFWTFARAWRVDSISNNGTIKAHDIHGRRHEIYERSENIIRVIKA